MDWWVWLLIAFLALLSLLVWLLVAFLCCKRSRYAKAAGDDDDDDDSSRDAGAEELSTPDVVSSRASGVTPAAASPRMQTATGQHNPTSALCEAQLDSGPGWRMVPQTQVQSQQLLSPIASWSGSAGSSIVMDLSSLAGIGSCQSGLGSLPVLPPARPAAGHHAVPTTSMLPLRTSQPSASASSMLPDGVRPSAMSTMVSSLASPAYAEVTKSSQFTWRYDGKKPPTVMASEERYVERHLQRVADDVRSAGSVAAYGAAWGIGAQGPEETMRAAFEWQLHESAVNFDPTDLKVQSGTAQIMAGKKLAVYAGDVSGAFKFSILWPPSVVLA